MNDEITDQEIWLAVRALNPAITGHTSDPTDIHWEVRYPTSSAPYYGSGPNMIDALRDWYNKILQGEIVQNE